MYQHYCFVACQVSNHPRELCRNVSWISLVSYVSTMVYIEACKKATILVYAFYVFFINVTTVAHVSFLRANVSLVTM